MRFRTRFKLEIRKRRILLGERTLIMGVLNVTPDSFSDGGCYLDPSRAIAHGLEMARQGADWVDVGGESTRPGSKPVPVEEELRRVLPVIEGLGRRMPTLPISIDTTKAEVAEQAVRAGATILNDISGLRFEPALADVARRHRTALVLMHLRGRPETMQERPFPRSLWRSVGRGLAWSVRKALARGVRRSQLIVDPGLGFGKSRRQNFEILAELDRLRTLRLPVLLGTSRKSFVQAVVAGQGLETPAKKRGSANSLAEHGGASPAGRDRLRLAPAHFWSLTGTGEGAVARGETSLPLQLGDAAAVTAAILGGAHIVRVHDVAAVLPAVRMADALLQARHRV